MLQKELCQTRKKRSKMLIKTTHLDSHQYARIKESISGYNTRVFAA